MPSAQVKRKSKLEGVNLTDAPVRNIPVGEIRVSPYQPRSTMDKREMAELVRSLKAGGQQETAVVREIEIDDGESRYELIAGHRRLIAAQRAKLKTLRAHVVQERDGRKLFISAVRSNTQREELTPYDRLRSCLRARDEFGMGNVEIGKLFGKSQQWAANMLALERLAPDVVRHLGNGKKGSFTLSVAHELVRLDHAGQREALAEIRRGAMGMKRARRVVNRLLLAGASGHPDAQERTGATESFARLFQMNLAEALSALRRNNSPSKLARLGNLDGRAVPKARETLAELAVLVQALEKALPV